MYFLNSKGILFAYNEIKANWFYQMKGEKIKLKIKSS